MRNTLRLLFVILQITSFARVSIAQNYLDEWETGYFDIHHIFTGLGNNTFFIFPDGTTLLFDAGGLKESEIEGTPLEKYLSTIRASKDNHFIDYAVISHFHPDHYGLTRKETPYSENGDFQLSGITDIGNRIPIRVLIDRGYPDYNFPVDLYNYKFRNLHLAFRNYRKFQDYSKRVYGTRLERLMAGSRNQIKMQHSPDSFTSFNVRNVKANGLIWTGVADSTRSLSFRPGILEMNQTDDFSENSLSLVLQFNYGKFDYFTGGDLLGYNQNIWGHFDYDFETPIADLLKEVDALALNHHGYKDANNTYFLETLRPQVAIQQSKKGNHFSSQLWHDLSKNKIDAFSLYLDQNHLKDVESITKNPYKSFDGHILIRVSERGDKFWIKILEYQEKGLYVKKSYGPYLSR